MVTDAWQRERFLNGAGIEPDMVVVEVHPSRSGMLMFALAERVGRRGRVHAVDPRREVTSWLEGLRRQREAAHIQVHQGDPEAPRGIPLDDGIADRIVVLNSLWLVRNVADYIQELRRLLRPRGEIIVVDWHPGVESPYAPPQEYRVAQEDACNAFHQGACYACGQIATEPTHWGWRFIRD